jgi:trans-aconitate methyltransferase
VSLEKKYFLPENYLVNPSISYDTQPEIEYWDKSRMQSSQSYQKAVYDWALKIIKKHKLRTLADVGCGYAEKLKYLHYFYKEIEITGFDQPNIIKICQKEHAFGNWIACDLENFPALTQKYDLVISSDVIEHLDNPDHLLNLIKNISHDDTLILISTPERDLARGSKNRQSPNKHHVREWNKIELAQYLESNGFEIIDHKILPALSFKFAYFYFYHVLKRLKNFQTINYNQAILAKYKA